MRSAPNFPRHFSQPPFKALSTSLHKLILKRTFFPISRKDIWKYTAYLKSGIVWVAFTPIQGRKKQGLHRPLLPSWIKTMFLFQMYSEVTLLSATRFGFFPLLKYKQQQLPKKYRNYQKSCSQFFNSLPFLLPYFYSSIIIFIP